jgi:GT2 family glycosyltransferase
MLRSRRMDLSIVICTRNRGSRLSFTLDRWLEMQANASWELVVVNNGSTDETAAVLERYGAAHSSVTCVSESKPGLGRARNTGWRAASAPIIAFSDDDCYPVGSFVDSVVEAFYDQAVGYIGGRIFLHDPSDLPLTIQLLDRQVELPPHSHVAPGFIQGANFAFRRDVLNKISGFDPRLGAGTPYPCEDVDVVGRASAAGVRGVYFPHVSVSHHHGRKTQDDARRLALGYDLGRGAYYAKMLGISECRGMYLRKWARMLATQNPLRSARELRAAVGYWGERLFTSSE